MHWIKVEPHYVEAQGPPLSTGVSFVRIDPGDWKLPQDNQRVSSSVFQRSPIIIVVGYRIQVEYWNSRIFFLQCPIFTQKKHTTFVVKDFSQNALFISLQYYYIRHWIKVEPR